MKTKMALFKKLLPNTVTQKKSKESLVSVSSVSSASSSKGSSCESNLSDIVDLFLMDTKYREKREGLNYHFERHRRRDRRLSRLKNGLVDMEKEMRELQRMINKTESEILAVERETKEKLEELENILKLVDKDTEVEVKKREPLLFKKYSNLKNTSDCQNLIQTVRLKQKALQYIELLIYRKYVKFQHGTHARSDKCKAKIHSLIPVKPTRLKDCRMFPADREQPEGVVFVEIEDQNPDVIDLTGSNDVPMMPGHRPYDVPLETEV